MQVITTHLNIKTSELPWNTRMPMSTALIGHYIHVEPFNTFL